MDFNLPKDELGCYSLCPDNLEKNLSLVLPRWMAYETRENAMRGYMDIMSVLAKHREQFAQPDGLIFTPAKGFCCVQCNTCYIAALADTLAEMTNQIYDEYRTVEGYFKQTALALLASLSEDGLLHNRLDAARDANHGGTARLAYALLKGIRLRAIPRKLRNQALALAKAFDRDKADAALVQLVDEEVAQCSL